MSSQRSLQSWNMTTDGRHENFREKHNERKATQDGIEYESSTHVVQTKNGVFVTKLIRHGALYSLTMQIIKPQSVIQQTVLMKQE